MSPHKPPRAEDVKEALDKLDRHGFTQSNLPHYHRVMAAARLWLASQATTEGRYVEPAGSSEQTPDITDEMVERAARAEDAWIQSNHLDHATPWDELTDGQRQEALDCARAGLQAALVGFHPQPERDER